MWCCHSGQKVVECPVEKIVVKELEKCVTKLVEVVKEQMKEVCVDKIVEMHSQARRRRAESRLPSPVGRGSCKTTTSSPFHLVPAGAGQVHGGEAGGGAQAIPG